MKWCGRHLITAVVGLLLLSACKPSIPEEVIQPDDMEDILYDYHVSQGMPVENPARTDYYRNLYFESVLKKHGVTKAEFDSSLVYYYTRADRLIDIYKQVQKRLGDEALVMGASAGEVERYSSLTQNGDTADVWEGVRSLMLMYQRPYHLYQFRQKADTTYHPGDSFLMTFEGKYLSQSSNKQAIVYLAVTYDNDSTVAQNVIVSSYSNTNVRIGACRERVKDIRGYIMMGQRMETNPSKDVCLLFLNQIRLIRFHSKEPLNRIPAPVDSAKAQKADTLRRDSVRRPVRRLGERPVPMAKPEPDRSKLQLNKPINR